MNEFPLVSVIVPSYNHKEYVLMAINSVLAQTYRNVELIVIDDGSTDGSIELLETASEDLEFLFIRQENSGVSRTLNRGIREFSNGKYICILASDDFFDRSKIERQVEAIVSSLNSELCYTQAIEFDGETGKTLRVFPRKKFSGDILKSIFIRQPYAAGSMLFSRALFDRLGGFDESLAAEDWDFSIRAAAVTSVIGVHEQLFHYRSHSSNAMKRLGRRRIFREKAIILSKNYLLVSPGYWLLCMLINFIHDHFYFALKYINVKRWLN